MNGRERILFAAKRKDWKVSDDVVNKMMRAQYFISNEYDLIIRVTYNGYTIKQAQLWDFSDKIVTNAPYGVYYQELTSTDRDKAGRIEDVLLGNSRRF